jgi:hypothetical protein
MFAHPPVFANMANQEGWRMIRIDQCRRSPNRCSAS